MGVAAFTTIREASDFISGTPARGYLRCLPKASYADNQRVLIPDGMNPTPRFIFDVSGTFVPPGGYDATHVRVDLSAAVSAHDVAVAIASAVTGLGVALAITATVAIGSNVVQLVNTSSGAIGNIDITKTTDPFDFTVVGMSGGSGPVLAASYIDLQSYRGVWYVLYRS